MFVVRTGAPSTGTVPGGAVGSGVTPPAATLSSVGTLPVAGLTLILGIDRFMSEARALTNVIGNGVATLVVAKWTGELDTVTMSRELGGAPARADGGREMRAINERE